MSDNAVWRVLIVDDEEDTCRQVKELLEGTTLSTGDRFSVESDTSFEAALGQLERGRFDILILDVRVGPRSEEREEEAGTNTLHSIRQRCFVPVVFYTGLPHLVRPIATPFIRVVDKSDSPAALIAELQGIVDTGLPTVSRALVRHVESVQRDYMWDFVATHWEQIGSSTDRTALAHLLARRLAVSLSGAGIRQLVLSLSGETDNASEEGLTHPMHYYLLPPVQDSPMAGDLYRASIDKKDGIWILLTPSCDMVIGREKASFLLFVRCEPLTDQGEFAKWRDGLPTPSRDATQGLERLLRNNRDVRGLQPDRFFFLPGALSLPDLVVDFQQLATLPHDRLAECDRLASLDSPFAEALLSRFIRYFGRLGVPDLDVSAVVSRLQRELSVPR